MTAEVKKKPARPKKTMNGKRACRHTSPYLFYIGERIYAVCVPFITFYMLIFFGEDLRLEIYEIVFPFIMLFDPPFVGFEPAEIKRRPAAASGQTRLVGQLQLYDPYFFLSFCKKMIKMIRKRWRSMVGI